MRKGRKEGGQPSANVVVSEAGGGSGYVPSVLLACQSTNWWIDTGANVHVCADYNLFSSYQACSGSTIMMGNETRAVVRGTGRVDLRLTLGKTLSLKNVRHVPGINRNLLSGSLLCRDGYKLVFESNKFVILKFGLFIGKGYNSGGLFRLSILDECNVVNNLSCSSYSGMNVGDVVVWHSHLCHINFDRIVRYASLI